MLRLLGGLGLVALVALVRYVGLDSVGLGWAGWVGGVGWVGWAVLGCVGLCWVVLSRVLLGCIGLCCVTLDPEISVKGVRMGGGVENPSDYITPYRPGNFCVEFYGEIKFEPSERFWA